MKVKELIEKLQKFDQELNVVTPGFDESNLDDIETIEVIQVFFNYDRNIGHCGRHQEYKPLYHSDRDPDPSEAVDAVFIDW